MWSLFKKKKKEEGEEKKQLSKNPKNNGGHVPPGNSCLQHNGLSAYNERVQLLQATWACPVFKSFNALVYLQSSQSLRRESGHLMSFLCI